jgi:hypothetical protein
MASTMGGCHDSHIKGPIKRAPFPNFKTCRAAVDVHIPHPLMLPEAEC